MAKPSPGLGPLPGEPRGPDGAHGLWALHAAEGQGFGPEALCSELLAVKELRNFVLVNIIGIHSR